MGSVLAGGSESSASRQLASTSTFLAQLSHENSNPGDVYMASLPKQGDLSPQMKKKKRMPPPSSPQNSRSGSRSPSKVDRDGKESRSGSKLNPDDMERKGSKCSVASEALSGPKPVKRKTAAQKQKEEEERLAQKDPFEHWRRNMASAKHMTYFQRQLKTEEGLSSLKQGMADESKKFKHFHLKDMDDLVLYDCRLKFGPAGMKTQQEAKKADEKFKSNNWSVTEEGEAKARTKDHLFKYYSTSTGSGEKPGLSDLKNLLMKSQTHGMNIEKLAKEEQKRQDAESKRFKFLNEGGFHDKYRRSAKMAGRSPKGCFHKTLTGIDREQAEQKEPAKLDFAGEAAKLFANKSGKLF